MIYIDPDIDTRPTSTADPDKVNFKNGRVSPTDKSDKDEKDKDKDKEKKEPEKMVGFFEVVSEKQYEMHWVTVVMVIVYVVIFAFPQCL